MLISLPFYGIQSLTSTLYQWRHIFAVISIAFKIVYTQNVTLLKHALKLWLQTRPKGGFETVGTSDYILKWIYCYKI
jgi:hypothetical protein